MKMSIEEKMAYVRKAIEMGASVDLHFHNFREKAEAKAAAMELSKLAKLQHSHKSHNGSNWYKIKNEDYTLETSIYYDDEKYMEEDIWGTEDEEHVS
jgi:hypothetical protein